MFIPCAAILTPTAAVRIRFFAQDCNQVWFMSFQTHLLRINSNPHWKGIDLLIATAPRICAKFPNVRFLVDVVRAISEAIEIVSAGKHDPYQAHERIKDFYDWHEITQRTELVYETVMDTEPYDFWTRLQRTLDVGPIAGIIYAIILLVDCLFFMFLEWWLPEDQMDKVQMHWSPERFQEVAVFGSLWIASC
ncbi:hypothetical protein GSI_10855 [Ganoderma sinense ZZ0214-1]|uniref:Uncharacterized protein n=1 Tax=Ganoderma sinense ZZ0214-1 TaxID=1077348 RepID=A0A2G8S1R6_9APHY|nr:hypothetical protein GSI_10855 [Ganoderma sinense ZZ0214-1]